MEGETEEGGLGLLCLLSKGLRLVKLSVRLVGTINYKNANFNVNRTKYFDQLPKMNFGTCLPVHTMSCSYGNHNSFELCLRNTRNTINGRLLYNEKGQTYQNSFNFSTVRSLII